MKKNIVFLPCINVGDGRSNPYQYSIDSWKYWCDKNNCDLIVMDQLLCPVEEMKITWQRWHALDILEHSNIEYDQVLMIDADTIIHPDTPNFFNLTQHKLTAVHNEGCYDWIIRSMENYYKHMFSDKPLSFNFWEYINAGFIIFNKTHKDFLQNFINFYHSNKELILNLQKTYYVGTDQPIFNHFLRLENVEHNFLPYEFNMCDLPRKEILDNELTMTKIGWIYHFNAIPQEFGKPEHWMEKTYKHLYGN
jgi:hypothetical protein